MDYFGYVALCPDAALGVYVGDFWSWDPELHTLTQFNTQCGRQEMSGEIVGIANMDGVLNVIGDFTFMGSQTEFIKHGNFYLCFIRAMKPWKYVTLSEGLGRAIFGWKNEQKIRQGLREARDATLDYLVEQGLIIPAAPAERIAVRLESQQSILPFDPPTERKPEKPPPRCMAPSYKQIGDPDNGPDPFGFESGA